MPFALKRVCERFARAGECAQRREQQKRAPAAGLQHRQRGRDDRIGVLEAVRLGQIRAADTSSA